MTELGHAFTQEHHNTQITFNFAGSSTLAAQIIEGAQADIFASANQQQMQQVIDSIPTAHPAIRLCHQSTGRHHIKFSQPDNV